MTKLNKETIQQLTRLCRIHCEEAEQESMLQELAKIVIYIEQLSEVNTENVAPCVQVVEGITNAFREDIVGDVLDRQTFLANAPAKAQVGGMIKVPPVMIPSF